LPDGTGIELLRTVREERPDLPFVLFTDEESEEIASEAISAGVTGYLQRGDTARDDRLTTRVRDAVAQYRTERELRERVKALAAIGTIRDLLAAEDGDSAGQLQRVVDHLPRSFQFPDRAVASLAVGDETFASPGHEPPTARLTVDDVTTAGTELTLTVGYAETPPTADDDPFLPEERELLETVLRLIAAHLDRRHVVEHLSAADRRLQLILENTTAVMYLKDTDGRYVFVNAEYERLFDRDREEIVGRTDREIHGGEMAGEVQANDRRVLETGAPIEEEERIDVGGEDRVFLSLKVPARNDAGEIEGVFGVSTDITDRKRYEQRLREEQRFVDSIFRSLPDVFYAFDTDCAPIRWNDQFEAVTGYSGEEIESMHAADFVTEAEADAVERAFRNVLENRDSMTGESVLETKAGDRIPYELTGDILEDADGNVRGVTGIGRDLSGRKKRERQLEGLNHSIKRFLSADDKREVAELGVEAAREILGLRANAIHLYDEASGELAPVAETDDLVDLIDDTPTFTEGNSTAWRVYESGEATAIDDVREDPDVYNPETAMRSELYLPLGSHGILIAGSPTPARFDEQDVTVGELLAAHLVSAFDQLEHEQQLRDRETELKRQNERLDQFSSMVSHDLRNPISIASGHLELYRESGDEGDLDRVERSLDRIGELVTDLTTLARHGSTDDEHELVSLPAVAEDAWDMVDTRSAALSTTEGTISGDRSQLQGLFENLFRNAVGHGGDDVTVRVGPLDDGFYVEDTGSGIPPEDRERVFEQGFSTGYGGSGVGLTIVSRIAQAHGLDVSLTESAEGGARFEFREAAEGESPDA
jgi:PAS domain S-box-containing protein